MAATHTPESEHSQIEKNGFESHIEAEPQLGLSQHGFDVDEEVLVGWRTWMAALAGSSCVFSGYYTGLMLGNTASAVMTDLGHPDLATWMPNSYAVITAALAGVVAGSSDIVGRKWVLIGGLTLALIGDIVVAASHNYSLTIFGAALSGGIFCNQGNFFSVPAEVLPRRYRGIGQTISTSAGGIGATLSLMYNGAAITYNYGGLSWRSGYIVGAVIHAISITMLYFFYNPLQSPLPAGETTFQALRKRVDWIGATLLALGVGLLMIGLTWGGVSYAWDSVPVICALVLGFCICLALAAHQIFINKHGILDRDLWTRNFMVAGFGCLVEGVIFYSFLLFFPLETVYLWGITTIGLDARLLAFFTTSAFVAPLVGLYTRKTRDLKWPLVAGWSLVLTSAIIFVTLGAGGSNAAIGALFILGVGFATPLALLFAAAQLATPPRLLGLATGQIIACRAIGQAIGASVLIAIFEAKIASLLPAKVAAAALKAGLPATSLTTFVTGIADQNATLIEMAPGVTAAITAAGQAARTDAFVLSFHYGWDTALAFVAVALLSIFALSGRKMKEQMTWLVERPITAITHVHYTEGVDPNRRHSILSAVGMRRESKESNGGRRSSLKVG